MKKLLSLVLSAVVAFSVMLSVSVSAFAQENTKQTAIELTTKVAVEETYEAIFNEYGSCKYDYEKWYKFTAPSNGWYEVEVENPYSYDNDGNTYISAYNQYGDYVDFSGIDSFTGKCAVYLDCADGETYYFEISVAAGLYEKKEYTISVAAKKHTHDLKMDYSYAYTDYTTASYSCRECDYSTQSKVYAPKSMSLSKASYVYDGKAKKPNVTVKDTQGNKISSKYYTVSYSKGRKNVGTYTVTVKFKGAYSSFKSIKKTFTIKPKSTSISKVTAGKKKFTVKWKKQATQTSGYEIQYATNSKFTKNKKTVTVNKNKTTSKSISKLKAKKKYYVRVRTYKTVNGKKIYSDWSKAKTVTTKK